MPPTADGVRHAYDTVAEDYARLLPDTRAETTLDLAMLDDFVAAVGPGARVLDAGCGAGRISRRLRDAGLDVEGIDLSPGMVAMARRDHPDISFQVGSIAALPQEEASCDGVVLWYSTIHTPRAGQAALYAEVARVLRPGGHVVVAFQAGAGVHDAAPSYRRHGHEVELVRHRFTPEEVADWLRGAGLEEVARMQRRPVGREGDDQAVVSARRPPAPLGSRAPS